jgi:hypothetical protein
MVKSKTAAEEVPELATLADDPAAPVDVLPTEMVAAVPVAPVAPVAPVRPEGMPKLKTAALEVPTFVTVAEEPGDSVVVVPAAIVAAVPGRPCGPGVPSSRVMVAGAVPRTSTATVREDISR